VPVCAWSVPSLSIGTVTVLVAVPMSLRRVPVLCRSGAAPMLL